jgi:Fic family protein
VNIVDTALFAASPVGRLVRIEGVDNRTGDRYEHFAFVPNPLPGVVALTQPTVRRMGEADRALGALNARIQLLPNPQLLVRPALQLEAKATSALEGTFATYEEVIRAEYTPEPGRSPQQREISNYIEAATLGIRMITEENLPISRRVLEAVQGTLVRGTRGDTYDAGRLRQRQVFIGDEGQAVEDSRFVPPPSGQLLDEGFSDWERWINGDGNDLPLIAKLALSHYQFETLHPFSDGNGRVGRLVIALQLMEARELDYPIINLSAWFEPRRTRYIDALRNVSITGDFDSWVSIFADAIKARCEASLDIINQLLEFKEHLIARLRQEHLRGHIMSLPELLIGYPILSIRQAAGLLGITYLTAQRCIQKLEALEVLQEVTGGDYGRLYFCSSVAEITRRMDTPQA